MPMLLRELAISGSRKSDGTANASGYVFLYQPGTTSLMTGWKDEALSQAWTTTAGGIQLDAGGRATIWVDGRVDVLVQDAAGADLQMLAGYADTPANDVTIANAGFTGAVTDPATGNVTQGAGGATNLDTVLTRAAASFGGTDFQFLESAGATPLNYVDVVRAIQITPQMFGARGDGVADDTTAIQRALNEIVRIGSGIVVFPKGIYNISASLVLPSGITGISLIGAGRGATTIRQTVVADALDIASSADCALRSMTITGGGVVWTTAVRPRVTDMYVSGGTVGMKFTGPVSFGDPNASSSVIVSQSEITGSTTALWLDNVLGGTVRDTRLNGGTQGGRLSASAASIYWSNVVVQGTTGVLLGSDVGTVGGFTFADCSSVTNPGFTIDSTALSLDPGIVQRNCGMRTITKTTPADGTTVARPDTNYDSNVIQVNTGAGTAILGLPLLTAGVAQDGKEFVLELWNGSGSGIVWSLNAIWHVNTTIDGTDGKRTVLRFRYDNAGTCWREMSRAVTT